MRIPFLSFAAAFGLAVCLAGCGTGGRMDNAPQNTNLTGDLPGTGSMAGTAFEDADQPYNQQDMGKTSRGGAPAGQVIEVDSTEARGNSRWSDKQTAAAGSSADARSRLDKTAGLRARYSLIGSNPKNRSRVGQNMGANNPESAKETIYVPQ